jgi:hypothetical protein
MLGCCLRRREDRFRFKFWLAYYGYGIAGEDQMKRTQWLSAAISLSFFASSADAGTLSSPYTDPEYLTKMPFGSHSHWMQPWRAYLETIPASRYLDGVGINFNVQTSNPEPLLRLLSRQGVRHLRVEIGWGSINYNDETQIDNAANLRLILLACKKYGIRPLILLNANHGVPCPVKNSVVTLAAPVKPGDTTILVKEISGIQSGFSGLSNVTDYMAAQYLITEVSGNRLTLAIPLSSAFPAGHTFAVGTWKYRPFGPKDSEDYQNTIAGWQRYVGTVGRFVGDLVGTPQDRGFDLEIWNELTFGSEFLYINRHYAQKLYNYDETQIWGNIVNDTASFVEANPALFAGVGLSNGFANTIPWPGAGEQPDRITAISKHPYQGRLTYPKNEYPGAQLDALFQTPNPAFIPSYSEFLPEYFGLGLQTETAIRDMAPISTSIYGGKTHGRFAGKVERPVWITEVNLDPGDENPKVSVERAWQIKAKLISRYLTFYLNKGVSRVALFGISGGDKNIGIVPQVFLDRLPNLLTTADPQLFISPPLRVIGHISQQFSIGLDRNLKTTRPLQVLSIGDTHDHFQFAGNGKPGTPNLYDRDVLVILPFQINKKRFVIPYYVMTRDVTKDLIPENFTVEIAGFNTAGAVLSVYDPIRDRPVPFTIQSKTKSSFKLQLTAADYPYLLTVQEK